MAPVETEPGPGIRHDSAVDPSVTTEGSQESSQQKVDVVHEDPLATVAELEASPEVKTEDENLSQPAGGAKAPPPGPPGPVDHGLICWLQVVGSFAMWTNSWGLVNSYGEFQTYYEVELLSHNTPSQISWVGSLQAFLLLFVGVLSGPIYDAGYFRHLCVFGTFMVVFGFMMTSICKEHWQVVLAQGITCGIGYGCLFLPGFAIVPQYFVKKRAFAGGLAAAGSGFGGVVYPIMFRRLQPVIGFGWTVRIMAFLALFFGIVAITTLRNKVPPGQMRQLVNPAFFRNVPIFLYTVGVLFFLMALYVPVYYIGTYGLQYGITDENLAFYLVPIIQSAGLIGRIALLYFADHIGPLNVCIPATLGASILAFAWIGIRNEGGLIAFAVLYGICFGVVLGLAPTCVVALTTDMKTLGSTIGTAFGIASMGVLVGTPISGAILRSPGGFIGLQGFTGGILMLSAILNICARVMKVGVGIAKV